jgi:hypothetical protein
MISVERSNHHPDGTALNVRVVSTRIPGQRMISCVVSLDGLGLRRRSAQIALHPCVKVALAISDKSAETSPSWSCSGDAMALKRAYGQAEKVCCLLLIEKGVHRILPLTVHSRDRAAQICVKVLPNLPNNIPASLACGFSAGLAMPGLSTSFAAELVEFGPLQDWPNEVAFCSGEQSRDKLLRFGLIRWIIPRLPVKLSRDR